MMRITKYIILLIIFVLQFNNLYAQQDEKIYTNLSDNISDDFEILLDCFLIENYLVFSASEKNKHIYISFNKDSFLPQKQYDILNSFLTNILTKDEIDKIYNQSYSITSTNNNSTLTINVTSPTDAGLYYSFPTIKELITNYFNVINDRKIKYIKFSEDEIQIIDFPSYAHRGIVEGFYGKPWSHQNKLDLVCFMSKHRMNSFYYAPKDDPYHRKLWRIEYPPAELQKFRELLDTANKYFVDLYYAISPGNSMIYSDPKEINLLINKINTMINIGVKHFAIFLDDISPALSNPNDIAQFKTLSSAHSYLLNKVWEYLKSKGEQYTLTACPTTYTKAFGSIDYLSELGAKVDKAIPMFWTGKKVVPSEISSDDAIEWSNIMKRKPVIWDNFPVNDGIPWRMILAPLIGRCTNLSLVTSGFISNPMNQAYSSMIGLATVSDYTWNTLNYSPNSSMYSYIKEQFKENKKYLEPFIKYYNDYWWDDRALNRQLFYESRGYIEVNKINDILKEMNEALKQIYYIQSFKDIFPELRKFYIKTKLKLIEIINNNKYYQVENGFYQKTNYNQLYIASKVSSDVTIDGILNEWDNRSFYTIMKEQKVISQDNTPSEDDLSNSEILNNPTNDNVFKAKYWFGFDGTNLYLTTSVIDKDIIITNEKYSSKSDCLKLVIDTKLRKHYPIFVSKPFIYSFSFTPGDFKNIEPQFSFGNLYSDKTNSEEVKKNTSIQCKKTQVGYDCEIKIPLTELSFDHNKKNGIGFQLTFYNVSKDKAGKQIKETFNVGGDGISKNPAVYPILQLTDPEKIIEIEEN